MTEGKPYIPWPEGDDKAIIQEMVEDPTSEQWHDCQEFVKKRVQRQAANFNIPQHHWDDIVQDTMIKIHRSLTTFHSHCTLKTWIVGIIHNCIIDDYRRHMRTELHQALSNASSDNPEHDSEINTVSNQTLSVEELCILHDALNRATTLIQEYLSIHAHQKRNAQILDMFINEERSYEEIARIVGCSAPVVGHVVRSAQDYVRKHLREKQ